MCRCPNARGVLVQLGAKWNALGIADAALARVMASLRERGARFIAAPAERDAMAAQFPALADRCARRHARVDRGNRCGGVRW